MTNVAENAFHPATEEELNARLARDPHDPFVIAIVTSLQERIRRDGVSREEALAAFFADNCKLNDKLAAGPAVAKVRSSTRDAHRATVAVAAFGFTFLLTGVLVAATGLERRIATISLVAVDALMVALYYYGLRWQRWVDLHPVAMVFIIVAASGLGGTFLFAALVWALNPFLSYGEILTMLFEPLVHSIDLFR